MSTNAQPRVLGRWCRTSRWCTLVHARRAFVTPADATSASCDVRSRDDSGRQRPRVAPSADRNVYIIYRLWCILLCAHYSDNFSAHRSTQESQEDGGQPCDCLAPLQNKYLSIYLSTDRDDCVAWRQRAAKSSASTLASGATSASRNVRGARHQRAIQYNIQYTIFLFHSTSRKVWELITASDT